MRNRLNTRQIRRIKWEVGEGFLPGLLVTADKSEVEVAIWGERLKVSVVCFHMPFKDFSV